MKTYGISLFLPCYNFTPNRLIENVKIISDHLKKLYSEFEIVIVDDTSNSATQAAIETLKSSGLVSCDRFTNGPSRRENLAVAMTRAKYEVLAYMDIDLATDLSHLEPLLDSIHKGSAVAIGSRYSGIKAERNAQRLIISKIYNFGLRLFFGSKVKDHTCGFKAFSKSALVPLVAEMGYDQSQRRGWFWDAECLIRAQQKNLKIAEIPVEWKADGESTFSIKREIRLIPFVFSFWFAKKPTPSCSCCCSK